MTVASHAQLIGRCKPTFGNKRDLSGSSAVSRRGAKRDPPIEPGCCRLQFPCWAVETHVDAVSAGGGWEIGTRATDTGSPDPPPPTLPTRGQGGGGEVFVRWSTGRITSKCPRDPAVSPFLEHNAKNFLAGGKFAGSISHLTEPAIYAGGRPALVTLRSARSDLQLRSAHPSWWARYPR